MRFWGKSLYVASYRALTVTKFHEICRRMDLSQINQASRSFRLVASEIDRIATESPEKPWASVPKNPENLSDGFEDVSYSQFAAAIDRASWYCHCPGLY